ncbi:ATP-binding cassette domain-containing protein [Pelomonas sp. CA6]|uniref:ATP-binding cassette domain-containing protein n=1 Tax=Pelomonas sp. CA6 TaxID=2907999 RepID=UPI001F4BD748|nr:ATP-binding cassette domain-containing protein [Pelomonas sp. CA6]MCH7343672.1 ATP-binding cassette domain-containing protein [Pelomonas sp. CA6]
MLTLEQIRQTQGRLHLGPLSLTVRAGERVAILGPSGAGKSTLLRLLSGELAPQQGQVLLDELPLRRWTSAALARRRAVLPQQHGVAFGLPVELVVALGRVARADDEPQSRIVRQALAQAHAEHLLGRRFDTLSGGEQARVQLARVFAQAWDTRDGLLLVDEPLAALDPGLSLALMDAMSAFAQERGHALIAVLHDLNAALNGFDRLWLLREGRLLADCAPLPAVLPLLEQLYELPLRLLHDEQGFAVLPRGRAPTQAGLAREPARGPAWNGPASGPRGRPLAPPLQRDDA